MWFFVRSISLGDHVTHSMEIPGGIYNTSWFLVMNEDMWNGVSAQDQAAIEGVSGEAFAQLAGQRWDSADADGAQTIIDSGIVRYSASDEIVAALQTLAAGYEADWATSVADAGFDGAAALAALRADTGQ